MYIIFYLWCGFVDAGRFLCSVLFFAWEFGAGFRGLLLCWVAGVAAVGCGVVRDLSFVILVVLLHAGISLLVLVLFFCWGSGAPLSSGV